ncbi:ferrous iron transport protein B [Aminivibrio pyruvatiphilus]|uniref:Ferrous iron transport protein B n=1 Tax=Aminivibrio pyruvatiphilus TaxID=1005740 RepID=A0A4R8MBI5_9BACT|nr:ferrous iron transport protein B [Aminivibrio pyruvatiphilus]TDY61622.1 ferrous iron transport protein B [Aminivibrio pyruvatiphilus]
MGYTVALTGNPNTGKTSLFNALTGSNQHVGNWPGVTVERKEGRFRIGDGEVKVVDLPGIYSLGAASLDEEIAADFLLRSRPDLAIVVADGSNLERSLYLAVQMLETGTPLVLALNMMDMAAEKGITIDVEKLSSLLGIPVVPTVARRKEGIEDLKKRVLQELKNRTAPLNSFSLPYGERLAPLFDSMEAFLSSKPELIPGLPARTAAVKFTEGDPAVLASAEAAGLRSELEAILSREGASVEASLGYDLQTAVIERRWGFVSGVTAESVTRDLSLKTRLSLSDRIDRVVTSRTLGLPLFFLVTWAIFRLTYALGDPLVEIFEGLFESLGERSAEFLAGAGLSGVLVSFIQDGLIGGVGSVVVFFPHIFILFAFIAVLEDSGYMARGAFVMDRLMHLMGLHGKSFIPMLMGFGCNVPSMMATRILERPRDRMITLLILPFMSCSARLPVFVLFSGAFFGAHAGTAVFSLYILGIMVAIGAAKILGSTLFKGESSQLVMELPPYHIPSTGMVLRHAWERGFLFLQKAGTFILLSVVAVWALASLPWGVEYGSEESLVGSIGKVLAPLFEPAGFGFWQAAVALFFGFLAKEVVVGTFGALLGAGEAGLTAALPTLFTPLSAYAFLVMTLLYVPCVAAVAAFRRETGSWKWTFFMIAYTTLVGYGGAVLVYQGGRLLGLG